MGLRSSHGSGRYAASEQDVYVADTSLWSGGGRGVLYFHGAGGTATNCRDYANVGELDLVNAVAQVFPVLSIDAGGAQAWGNPTSALRAADGRTRLQGTPVALNGPYGAKPGTVLCIGSSMGALTALNFAKANPTLVSCVVGLIPIIDVNDVVTNNRGGFAAAVNAAYGGTYVEATNGPTSNPANYAASMTVPTRLFYSSDDPTAIPGAVTAYAATAANVTATSLGALGHTQAAIDAAPRDQIVAFLRQYA